MAACHHDRRKSGRNGAYLMASAKQKSGARKNIKKAAKAAKKKEMSA